MTEIDIDEELSRNGLDRKTYESCLRDIREKTEGGNDLDWADIVNKYGLDMHSDTLRKASRTIFGGAFVLNNYRELEAEQNTETGYLAAVKKEKNELIKERQKLQDERIEYQRLLREEARKESFIELIKRVLRAEVRTLSFRAHPEVDSDNDMIVCLSDIHAGIEVKNFFNSFDTRELKSRLRKYLGEIVGIQRRHRCKECYLVLGGDLISGWIHKNLRLQNNENVIEQVKTVSVLLGDFVSELGKIFECVKIYSVAGNHSRLSPAKEEQLKGEELDALIPFYLGLMFKENPAIKVYENVIDDTILSFKTRGGFLFYGVHGDRDGLSSVVKNLTLMTGVKPDGIIIGHRHHNGYNSEHGVKVIQCGCVVGTDDYCVEHRISGRPEQCVVITDDKAAVQCFYDVGLKGV